MHALHPFCIASVSFFEDATQTVLHCAVQAFVDMCRQPVLDYLNRFDFKSPLLKSMYAVTDGFSGLTGSWKTPGTGLNFLMHNMVSYYACAMMAQPL